MQDHGGAHQIVQVAIELPSAERRDYLEGIFEESPELREPVEKLLHYVLTEKEESPEEIGVWTIYGELGRGGMGIVFEARHKKWKNPVAIKRLYSHLPPSRFQRLEREARLLAAVSHENVAAFHSYEEGSGSPYLVMELVRGQTLASRVSVGLSYLDALTLSVQLCRGLAALHDAGLVHRDLKPTNVMVSKEGTIKLLDFGIAESGPRQDQDPASVYSLATRRGTMGFVSPEQLTGAASSFRSDLYSLGCVLCYVFGIDPSQGESVGPKLQAPSELSSKMRAPVRAIITSCLETQPDARPASARKVMDLLETELEFAQKGTGPRAAWTVLALVAALFLAIFIAWMWLPTAPASVSVEEHQLRVRMTWGRDRILRAEPGTSSEFRGAFLVKPTPNVKRPWIVAWTSVEDNYAVPGHLPVWDDRLRLRFDVQASRGSPYFPPPSPAQDIKQFIDVRLLGEIGADGAVRLGCVESSSALTSLVRAFDFRTVNEVIVLTEAYRLYHEGQISEMTRTQGPRKPLLWLVGTARGGGAVREACGWPPSTTRFLAAFAEPGFSDVEVFSPTAPVVTNFLELYPETRLARPMLYFGLRAYTPLPNGIDWEDGPTPLFDQVRFNDAFPDVIDIRTSETLALHATIGPSSIDCRWTLSDAWMVGNMMRRAEALGISSGQVMDVFLADSVICLFDAQLGLSMEGNFRDVRAVTN